MVDDNNQPSSGSSINRALSTFGLIVGILLIAVIGYLVIDTVLTATRPARTIPNAVGTQVQQVLNPTPTVYADPVTVIKQIRNLSRLETASYTIEKVITAESGVSEGLEFLVGDELLLVAQGEVIAGVDLSRIGEDDIEIVDGTVFITVPAAEIFVATLDNDETYVYDRRTGILTRQDINLETLARQEAERVILDAALDDGILRLAQGNAETTLQALLLGLGFDEVVFITATPAPDQDIGE